MGGGSKRKRAASSSAKCVVSEAEAEARKTAAERAAAAAAAAADAAEAAAAAEEADLLEDSGEDDDEEEDDEDDEESDDDEDDEDDEDLEDAPDDDVGLTEEEKADADALRRQGLNVSFEFFDPDTKDYHGLRALLQRYLDDEEFALSELCDTIIAQKTVGTVLKAGDDDPIGVITALNLKAKGGLQCVQQVGAYLRKRAPKERQSQLEAALTAEKTALVVSERFVNVPPEVAPPLQEALFDEISWATEDEPTEELRQSFVFERYLMFTRAYVDPDAPPPPAKGKGKGKAEDAPALLVYARAEDEAFHAQCEWSFQFPASGAPQEQDALQPVRLVMLVDAGRVPAARARLAELVAPGQITGDAAAAPTVTEHRVA